ncbi:MAG: YbaB/EbfC family nucleoid-associated protein [Actinomycetota bacterium]|nr:YbaB/EbfC family nucleoid-associated protein [Actinomycetota bacterium]
MTLPDVDALMAQVQAQQDEVLRIQKSVEGLEIKAGSRDDEVRVTLSGNGDFTEISIDQQALRRYDAHQLGELLVEAVNAGIVKLRQASAAKFAPLIESASGIQGVD